MENDFGQIDSFYVKVEMYLTILVISENISIVPHLIHADIADTPIKSKTSTTYEKQRC